MNILSYIVARDYGFAPNPFYGYCTLATCKPDIRENAAIGDWIVGNGAKTKYNLAGRLIYAMKVDEILDFNSYWTDPRFLCKRPILNGSLKRMYGDNIYHQNGKGWQQAYSHHSLENGQPNPRNIDHDTRVNRVLVASKFVYFGSAAPQIPDHFRPYCGTGEDICWQRRGYRRLSHELATSFESWLDELGTWGVLGTPLEYASHVRPRR